MKLPSYPKIWNLGHPRVRQLLDGGVVVEEKLDGSQFSFGVVSRPLDGEDSEELFARSKGAQIDLDAPPDLFGPAVATARRLHGEGKLVPGWVYRGEALCRPKHNSLAYSRAPEAGVVLFDIDVGHETRMNPMELWHACEDLGLEMAPVLFHGHGDCVTQEKIEAWMDESMLGGIRMEGVVIKSADRFDEQTGHQLMGKYVRPEFRELNKTNWTRPSTVEQIIGEVCTEARWQKAVQRLRDEDGLQYAPQDISNILRSVQQDLLEEEGDAIKERLFKAYWKQIGKGATKGLPEWWKEQLLQRQFEGVPS